MEFSFDKPKNIETGLEKNDLEDPTKVFVFSKGDNNLDGVELNGVELSTLEAPNFAEIPDQDFTNEPEFEILPGEEHLRKSAGVIIIEDDGRIWVYEPKNHFGGYEHTFPKGRVEDDLTSQQTAIKEAMEEVGLLVDLQGYLGDYVKTVTKTRYYVGKRKGGSPSAADSYREEGDVAEVESVKLVPQELLVDFLNTTIDKKIAANFLAKINN